MLAFPNPSAAFAQTIWCTFRHANLRISAWVSMFRSHEVGLDRIFLQGVLDGAAHANAFLDTSVSVGLSFGGNIPHNRLEVFDVVTVIHDPLSGIEKAFVFQMKRLWPDAWQAVGAHAPIPAMPAEAQNSIERAWFQIPPVYGDTSVFGVIRDPFPPASPLPPTTQAAAIDDFDSRFWPVYYLLYSPMVVHNYNGLAGTQVLRSNVLHASLRAGGSRTLRHIFGLGTMPIEDFMAREALGCREGGPAGTGRWTAVEGEFAPRAVVTIENAAEPMNVRRRPIE